MPRRQAKKLPVIKPTPQMAYQWASTHPDDELALIRYFNAGWKKSKRHVGRDRNVPPGVVLLEISREKHREMHRRDVGRAKAQFNDANKLFGIGLRERRGFPLVSPDFMVSIDYPSVPADAQPVDVEISIKVRISSRWQDGAACLGLSLQEYTRRRLLMEPPVLGPSSTFSDDNAYEPVQLSFSRKD